MAFPFSSSKDFCAYWSPPARIVSASGRYALSHPDRTKPTLTVSDAYQKMRQQLPNLWKTADGNPSPHDGATGQTTFEADPRESGDSDAVSSSLQQAFIRHVGMDVTDELTARLSYFLDGAQPRLAWEFSMKGTQGRFDEPATRNPGINGLEVLVDAQDGKVLYAVVEKEYLPHGIAMMP